MPKFHENLNQLRGDLKKIQECAGKQEIIEQSIDEKIQFITQTLEKIENSSFNTAEAIQYLQNAGVKSEYEGNIGDVPLEKLGSLDDEDLSTIVDRLQKNLLRVLLQKQALVEDDLYSSNSDQDLGTSEELGKGYDSFEMQKTSQNGGNFDAPPAVAELFKAESLAQALTIFPGWKEGVLQEWKEGHQASSKINNAAKKILDEQFLPRVYEFYVLNYPRVELQALYSLFCLFKADMIAMGQIVSSIQMDDDETQQEKEMDNALKACLHFFQTRYLALPNLKPGRNGDVIFTEDKPQQIRDLPNLSKRKLKTFVTTRIETVAKLGQRIVGIPDTNSLGNKSYYESHDNPKDKRIDTYIKTLVEMKVALKTRFPQMKQARYREALTKILASRIESEIKTARDSMMFHLKFDEGRVFKSQRKPLFNQAKEGDDKRLDSLYHTTAWEIKAKIAEIDNKPEPSSIKKPKRPEATHTVEYDEDIQEVVPVVESPEDQLRTLINKSQQIADPQEDEDIEIVGGNTQKDDSENERKPLLVEGPSPVIAKMTGVNNAIVANAREALLESASFSAARWRNRQARGLAVSKSFHVIFSKDNVVPFDNFKKELTIFERKMAEKLQLKTNALDTAERALNNAIIGLTHKEFPTPQQKDTYFKHEVSPKKKAFYSAKAALYQTQFDCLFESLKIRLTGKFASDLLNQSESSRDKRRMVEHALQHGSTTQAKDKDNALGLESIKLRFNLKLQELTRLRDCSRLSFAQVLPSENCSEYTDNTYLLYRDDCIRFAPPVNLDEERPGTFFVFKTDGSWHLQYLDKTRQLVEFDNEEVKAKLLPSDKREVNEILVGEISSLRQKIREYRKNMHCSYSAPDWQLCYINKFNDKKKLMHLEHNQIPGLTELLPKPGTQEDLSEEKKRAIQTHLKLYNEYIRDTLLLPSFPEYQERVSEQNMGEFLNPQNFHNYYADLAAHLDEAISATSRQLAPLRLPEQRSKSGFFSGKSKKDEGKKTTSPQNAGTSSKVYDESFQFGNLGENYDNESGNQGKKVTSLRRSSGSE
jgi:hypothetical protein